MDLLAKLFSQIRNELWNSAFNPAWTKRPWCAQKRKQRFTPSVPWQPIKLHMLLKVRGYDQKLQTSLNRPCVWQHKAQVTQVLNSYQIKGKDLKTCKRSKDSMCLIPKICGHADITPICDVSYVEHLISLSSHKDKLKYTYASFDKMHINGKYHWTQLF